jgi:AcrR family transcriptional regulator
VTITNRRIADAAARLFAQRGSADVTMSELALEAGVARATLYRNVASIDALFDDIVAQLVEHVHRSIAGVLDADDEHDPALRLATALRLLARFAHEDPSLAAFLVQFGLSEDSLRGVLTGPPMADVRNGLDTHRYAVGADMSLGVATLLIGTAVSSMWMVLEGHEGWRESGSMAAELVLCALGIEREEARELARRPLPQSPSL